MYRARAGWLCLGLVTLILFSVSGEVSAKKRKAEDEVQYPDARFKKLEGFEANRLQSADKPFVQNKYKEALAAYDAFIIEFGSSDAVPYALLRKGRCLQKLKKRAAAVREYQEILDYFPEDVTFAAPALFYQGQCHWQNGDEKKALAVWAQMVKHGKYSKNPLAAQALYRLAEGLEKHQRYDQAAEYYEIIAETFRKSNRDAANQAIDKVIDQYVFRNPDEKKLRAFFGKVGSFDSKARKVAENVEDDKGYWDRLRRVVKDNARRLNPKTNKVMHDRYYQYWGGVFDSVFPAWDDLQIDAINLHFAHEKSREKWMERLDAQFAANQKPGDWGRINRWISIYAPYKGKVKEYYEMIDFTKMPNDKTEDLLMIMLSKVKDNTLASAVFGRIRLDSMKDGAKESLAKRITKYDSAMVKRVCLSMEDADRGKSVLLSHYAGKKDLTNALPLADVLKQVDTYAADATWTKAELLFGAKKYSEAIGEYQQVERPPENYYRIADCYANMNQLDQAVSTLRQIENFYEKEAPNAAVKIGHLYLKAGKKDSAIGAYRHVMKNYPKTKAYSAAHNKLEAMGVRIGGGVDAE